MLGRTIRTLLEVRQETEVHFLFGTVILGLLSIFKKSQASSHYEALNSVCLWRSPRDVRSPVQMRRKPMTFSRVSTGDSDMPSSCEMKDDLNISHCIEIGPSFESGPFGANSTRDRKDRVPLTSLLLRETLLEVLVESWLTSSAKNRESDLILGRYGVHGAFLELLY